MGCGVKAQWNMETVWVTRIFTCHQLCVLRSSVLHPGHRQSFCANIPLNNAKYLIWLLKYSSSTSLLCNSYKWLGSRVWACYFFFHPRGDKIRCGLAERGCRLLRDCQRVLQTTLSFVIPDQVTWHKDSFPVNLASWCNLKWDFDKIRHNLSLTNSKLGTHI